MIPDGASLMIGGFMGCGTPEPLMDELLRQGKRELTVIANDTATPGVGIGKLVHAKLVRRAIVSHIGLNPETQQQMIAGELEVQLVPQGTLSRAHPRGGAGLGGVLTPDGTRNRGRGGQTEDLRSADANTCWRRALRGLCARRRARFAITSAILAYALTAATSTR